MPTLTVDEFKLGLDRRRDREVAKPDRLFQIQNAFVTTGYAIQKRAGLNLQQIMPDGAVGLAEGLGKLNTFTHITAAPETAVLRQHQIPHPVTASQPIDKIHFADVFSGFLYVVAEYVNGDIYHHYLDGMTPTAILDPNNPRSKAVTFAKSKVYAVGPEEVRYSATEDPRDWTTVNDAGFLPTGTQASGDAEPLGLAQHRGRLAVVHRDAVQVWNVDPDPALSSFVEEVSNSGSRYPRSLHRVAGDIFFLSNAGFRSISQLQFNQSLDEIDVGTPIDDVVVAHLKTATADPVATYYDTQNQYLCAVGRTIYAFHFSKTAKVSAWQQYTIPANVLQFAEFDNQMYMLLDDGQLYTLDPDSFSDGGVAVPLVVETHFIDFKNPTKMKTIHAFDCAMTGDANIYFMYDERDTSLQVGPMQVRGATRAGELYPIGLMTPSIAIRFENDSTEDFRLKSYSLHFEMGLSV